MWQLSDGDGGLSGKRYRSHHLWVLGSKRVRAHNSIQRMTHSSERERKTALHRALTVGFNPVQKLPAYELLNKENKQCESITHKTHMHRDFLLYPKTGTTSLIFHYFPFNVTIHIYTCRSIQYHEPKNHRVQNHGPKNHR